MARAHGTRPEERISIGWLRLVDVLYSRIYHHVDVQSPCPLPRTGAGILVCNHISGLDPVLIQSVCPRLIVWMMAEEYASLPLLGPLFKAIHTIPVHRKGQDLAATRQALRALQSGFVLGIFPEGKIETGAGLLPFQPGVAMIAQRTGLPVYPAYIDGTSRGVEMPDVYLRRQEIKIWFGERFLVKSEQMLDNSVETIRNEIANLGNVRNRQKATIFPLPRGTSG
ncbi:MAG TPA: lysophospholipid acyltransferase family protein [Tepidisphaeraceae bacterium]|nr:lysophospholipid acyltransferase family protein [Tepidisphaeraceae bacterium]